MKAFAVIIVLTAVGVFGGTFFGMFTVPGLEDFPTVDSIGKKNQEAKEKAAAESQEPKGIFPVNKSGATAERNKYLQNSQKKVAPGG